MKRSGFTLVEFIVVLGVVGTILALLVPALRGAAEAARRVRCLNNLKQIHLALQSYHGTHRVYPPGVVDEVRPLLPTTATRRTAWTAMVLPWGEQTAVYNAINFDVASTDAVNSTARRVQISMWLCPDSAPDRSTSWSGRWMSWFGRPAPEPTPEQGRSSYAACHDDLEKAIDADDHGVFFLNSHVRAADVFDGLSQTIFVGEVFEPAADGWFVGGRSTLRNTGAPINGLDAAALGDIAGSDAWRDPAQALGELETLSASGKITLPPGYVGSFGSRHRGAGAIFAFGDGAVRFVRQSIDPVVYRRLGNRDDGEEVDDDAF
jgi:prepilin-type N-terminal cleavage/methylation domain-containing protein